MKLFAAILLPAILLSGGFAAEQYDEDVDGERDLASWTGPYKYPENHPWWYSKYIDLYFKRGVCSAAPCAIFIYFSYLVSHLSRMLHLHCM